MNKYLKILSFYTLIYTIILFFLFLIEIFFGYWLDEHNFGPDLRGKRIQKIIFKNDLETTYFYKDFYGFRGENENIYEQYDTSKIKIVFNGGSTAEEKFLNFNQTIVGNLNEFFKDDEIDFKIVNAAVSGKSLIGHINEFSTWFDNIPNFRPEVMIYYIGINDRKILKKKRWHNYEMEFSFFEKVYWNFTQKSILWEKLSFVKNKLFNKEVLMDKYFTASKKELDEIRKNNIITYDQAKILYQDKTPEDKKVLNNFIKNLEYLKKNLVIKKIDPIFITQITHNINGEKILFFINQELKKFCEENNFDIVKLDELIKKPLENSFIDFVHTNKNGSKQIAEIIYPQISHFLMKKRFNEK